LHPVDPSRWHQPQAWIDSPFPSGCVILIGNPNNPVGCTLPASELSVRIATSAHQDIHWILDEAFVQLCPPDLDASLAPALQNHSNACIAGSLTKTWAIPGLRLGYLLHPDTEVLGKLRSEQETWLHGSLTHFWCHSMLQPHHLKGQQSQRKEVAALRQELVAGIETTALFRAYPSEVNYVLLEWMLTDVPLADLVDFLRNHQIHVRGCDRIPGIPPGRFIRIAVRDACSNQRLLHSLQGFRGACSASIPSSQHLPVTRL
jgi:threonine-phosphate decarboxylase